MVKQAIIYCPHCRGRFGTDVEGVVEDDIIECELCGAEMIVTQEDPFKIKLYSEEEDDY